MLNLKNLLFKRSLTRFNKLDNFKQNYWLNIPASLISRNKIWRNFSNNIKIKKMEKNPTKKKTASIVVYDKTDHLGDGKFDKESITISSWNLNGIRAVQRKGLLKPYFDDYDFDIICFNETKIDDAKCDSDGCRGFFSEEWHQYWNFCTRKAGYSGTLICSKVKPISIERGLGTTALDNEGRLIALEYEKFYLVCTYVPNSGRGLTTGTWDPAMRNFLNDLKSNKPTIWCGDLNVAHHKIDIARPNPKLAGFSPEERAEFQKLLDDGWVDTFRKRNPEKVKYSWWNTRSKGREKGIGWRLDYFIVNDDCDEAVTDSIILNEVMGSDHCPIELNLDLTKL